VAGSGDLLSVRFFRSCSVESIYRPLLREKRAALPSRPAFATETARAVDQIVDRDLRRAEREGHPFEVRHGQVAS
jgi:hypothetical protein